METLFETARLIVRKFRDADAAPLYENHRDAEVRKWFPNECYADEAEALDAIRFYTDCVDNGHLPFVLAVELKEALAILSPEDRDIVLLSAVAGYKTREIADMLHLNHATVRSKLSRALAKMKTFLE